MTTCSECKNYFPIEDEENKGDCVLRGRDARQEYWMAKPVAVDADASQCSSFQKK
ncbi:MAG: benzylsuccinate synthase gamma subunit family protein [Dehalococcoidia bacterium]|nr:benzylsuccinate synthase gamma subunit family protein [Dehalococcoidia bacterium]